MRLTVDFETTNFSKGSALDKRNRIVMVSWVCDDGEVCHFHGNIMDCPPFFQAVEQAEQIVAFNAKFEMLWFLRLGIDIDAFVWHDPMLAERVLKGNRRPGFSMEAVALRYGWDTKDAMIDAMMKAGVCPSQMPVNRLISRCNRDVRVTRSMHCALTHNIKVAEQTHLYRNRCEFAVVLAHIEHEGMILDSSRVQNAYKTHATLLGQLDEQLVKITGGINLNSPDQKAHFLYGKKGLGFPEKRANYGKKQILRNKPSKQFPKGRPKTDKATVAWLATVAETDNQKLFLGLLARRAKTNAALTKNLEFFQGVCKERQGKFHAQFSQVIAATHRLTSSGIPIQFEMFDKKKSVQFQNMPRIFKSLFKAPKGYKIAEIDASQLEFRVAAFVGDDPQARKDILDPDFDAHVFSASKIHGCEYRQLLNEYRDKDHPNHKRAKQWRREAKEHTFKPLYGGKMGSDGEMAYYREFNERYSALAATQETWVSEVQRTGELDTPWGMHFSWDTYTKPNGMLMDAGTHKPVGPQIYNYPVQNLATAEIVPIAITSLYRRCKEAGLDVKFVNTIHDSVIVYFLDDGPTEVALRKFASEAFTTDVYAHLEMLYGIKFDVPLGMEMVAGDHWSEGEEWVYDDVTNGGQNG